jgi:hypothetical protein
MLQKRREKRKKTGEFSRKAGVAHSAIEAGLRLFAL